MSNTRNDVSSDEIRAIAQLACLRVEPEELPGLTRGFNAVLELFDTLQGVATEGVEPMANPLDATQSLREDCVTEGDARSALQSVAPAVEDGLFLVPRVIE